MTYFLLFLFSTYILFQEKRERENYIIYVYPNITYIHYKYEKKKFVGKYKIRKN